MTTKKLTKLLALCLPYILLGLVATNFGEAWRLSEGKERGDKIMSMMGTISVAFANPLPSLHPLDILVGLCCGAGLRLGGSEPTTLKDLSEMLGKETIDAFNTSDTRGNSPSYGTTFQKMGHELLSRDELAVLDGGKCILQLRGVRPFLSDKYDLTQHPNYKLTSDYDPKNTFDIEKYLNRKEKINPHDEFVVIDADSLPPA